MPKKKTIDPSLIKESFYKVERLPNGFKIFREDYLDAEIVMSERFFLQVTFNRKDGEKDVLSCCFMNFYALKKLFVDEMFRIWTQKNKEKIEKTRFKKVNKKLKAWIESKFERGLTFVLYPLWKEITPKFEPEVYGIFKRFMVVRGPKREFPHIFFNNKLYENKGLINDLLNYNAIHFCIDKAEVIDDLENPNYGKIMFSHSILLRCTNYGRKLDNWRLLFSDCDHTYKALNKTLNNMPRGIQSNLVDSLARTHIPEPITDRVKLVAIMYGLSINANKSHIDCLIRSSPEQIRKAFKLFKKNYEKVHKRKMPQTLRGCRGIANLINYAFDYDGTHEGEIVGLLEKAHRWHQDAELRLEAQRQRWAIEAEQRRQEYEIRRQENAAERAIREAEERKQEEEDRKKPTKAPPIELPNREEIRFLDTVESVFQEGMDMGHCISSYAKKAMDGECYLFHIEVHGEKASTMIDKDGRLIQSYGPRNCVNKASEWGGNVLGSWGKKLADFLREQGNGDKLLSISEQMQMLQPA
jgi:hypothetical protein